MDEATREGSERARLLVTPNRFLAIADITRFTVYGSPSDEVRKILDSMGATYMEAFGGFAR